MQRIHRRELLKTVGSLAATAAVPAGVLAQETVSPQTRGAPLRTEPRPAFDAAVLRLPALVPPSVESFPDIRRRNAENMVAAIDDAMAGAVKPKLLVFPVLPYTSSSRSTSGVPMSDVAVDLISEPLGKGIFGPVVDACRRHNCYVATTTQEKTPQFPGLYHHTGFIMGPEGLVLRSPKAQAYSAPDVTSLRDMVADYQRAFGADSIFPVVETPIGRLGCFVESEAQVMEAARLIAAKGAEVIVHPSAETDDVPWQAIKQATAYECHVYLLTGCTSRNIRADTGAAEWRAGAATIVGPTGELVASLGGRDEGSVTAHVDLAAVYASRRRYRRATSPATMLYEDLYTDAG